MNNETFIRRMTTLKTEDVMRIYTKEMLFWYARRLYIDVNKNSTKEEMYNTIKKELRSRKKVNSKRDLKGG